MRARKPALPSLILWSIEEAPDTGSTGPKTVDSRSKSCPGPSPLICVAHEEASQ